MVLNLFCNDVLLDMLFFGVDVIVVVGIGINLWGFLLFLFLGNLILLCNLLVRVFSGCEWLLGMKWLDKNIKVVVIRLEVGY